MEQFINIINQLNNGFLKTLILFVLTLVFSLPLGLVIAFGSMSKVKPIKVFSKGLVWIIRGTPLMLQIILVSFIPNLVFNVANKNIARLLNIKISTLLFIYVLIAFIINYAVYFSEIYRSGIESINKGQYEAAKVLGVSNSYAFKKVILMQVIKRIVPPISNEIITLVKDTALASNLGVIDLLSSANHAVNEFVVLTPLIYAAIYYLIFNGLVTLMLQELEKKLSYFEA